MIFLQLSDGRFDGDGIDEVLSRVSVPITRRIARLIYKSRHREKFLAQKRVDSQNRRARKRRAGGVVTLKEWTDLLIRHNNACLCCGRNDTVMTQDHVLPISLGGSNTIDNIQPLCALCNSLKGAKYIDYR